AVYREDLGLGGALPRAQIHPDNLWALRGLLDCLERRGETAEAALIRQRLDFAAARADTPVAVSCFCARSAAAAEAELVTWGNQVPLFPAKAGTQVFYRMTVQLPEKA